MGGGRPDGRGYDPVPTLLMELLGDGRGRTTCHRPDRTVMTSCTV